MRIIVAEHAGVCYGVERALRLAEQAVDGGGAVHTLGPLIHNPQAVAALEERGVAVADSVDDVREGTLVIRTHGVDPARADAARAKGLSVVDATCPFVSTAQRHAAELAGSGYSVFIVGEAHHPEVEGILAYTGARATVIERVEDVPRSLPSRRIGIVVQTTQSTSLLEEIVSALLPRVNELRVFNTICSATSKRQQAADELARDVNVMVVVGGKNSGNTTRLAEICAAVNERVHHVETFSELEPDWFDDAETVGVTAGASTPDEQIAAVIAAIEVIAGDD